METPIEPPATELMSAYAVAPDAATVNLIEKADAGAGLVYAIYFHPQAAKLFASEFGTDGLAKAYMKACEAYAVGDH